MFAKEYETDKLGGMVDNGMTYNYFGDDFNFL